MMVISRGTGKSEEQRFSVGNDLLLQVVLKDFWVRPRCPLYSILSSSNLFPAIMLFPIDDPVMLVIRWIDNGPTSTPFLVI